MLSADKAYRTIRLDTVSPSSALERSVVDRDASAAAVPVLRARSEALDDVGLAITVGVAHCDEKTPCGRGVL